jgi:hypothetical protein
VSESQIDREIHGRREKKKERVKQICRYISLHSGKQNYKATTPIPLLGTPARRWHTVRGAVHQLNGRSRRVAVAAAAARILSEPHGRMVQEIGVENTRLSTQNFHENRFCFAQIQLKYRYRICLLNYLKSNVDFAFIRYLFGGY